MVAVPRAALAELRLACAGITRQLQAHAGVRDYRDRSARHQPEEGWADAANIYELKPRVIPVTGSKKYGRDGILAHPFMLGDNGQSNGCVSFKDYQAFLKAYQRGEVTRMVVVEQLDDPPGGRTAADWFLSTLKRIVERAAEKIARRLAAERPSHDAGLAAATAHRTEVRAFEELLGRRWSIFGAFSAKERLELPVPMLPAAAQHREAAN